MSRPSRCPICTNDEFYRVAQLHKSRFSPAQIAEILRDNHGLDVRTEDVKLHLRNCNHKNAKTPSEANLLKRLEKLEKKVKPKKSRGRPRKKKVPTEQEQVVDKKIEKQKVKFKHNLLKELSSNKTDDDEDGQDTDAQIRRILRKRWDRVKRLEEAEVLFHEGVPQNITRQELKDLSSDLFNLERLELEKDTRISQSEQKQAVIQQMTINLLSPMTDIKKLPENVDPMRMISILTEKLSEKRREREHLLQDNRVIIVEETNVK